MRARIRKLRFWWWRSLLLLCVAGLLLITANAVYVLKQAGRTHHPESTCPSAQVGIVFGTSQYLRSGLENPHFHGRVELGARLFMEGQVSHLLLSGDHRTPFYNEPLRMQEALLQRGVPAEAMTLDSAGLSTFDTLKRASRVYLLEKPLLITQDYHLPRALFIAEYFGLDAQGCIASGPGWSSMKRLWLRELAARLRSIGDLYIWQRQPDQMDEPRPIPTT